MSLLRFCEWLAATPGSIALHESRYLYLVVLSVHVLTLCLFVGTAAMIDLRLMGLTMQRVRVSEVMARLLPWTTAGFLLMILSGSLLLYAAPLLRSQNIFFRAIMLTLDLSYYRKCPSHGTGVDWRSRVVGGLASLGARNAESASAATRARRRTVARPQSCDSAAHRYPAIHVFRRHEVLLPQSLLGED